MGSFSQRPDPQSRAEERNAGLYDAIWHAFAVLLSARTVGILRWRASATSLVPGDKLIGNVVQVIAHELRLRTDSQNIVADALDQRGLPARCDGAEGVPCVQAMRQSWEGATPSSFST